MAPAMTATVRRPLLVALTIATMAAAQQRGPAPDRLVKTVKLPADPQDRRAWRDYAGSPDNSRFSSSTEIDKTNVSKLVVAWHYPHGDTGFNPVVVRGVVYARGRNSSLIALDAR